MYSLSIYYNHDNKTKLLFWQLLEKESDIFKGKESTAVRKAKDYYNACMNLTFADEAGSQPLKEVNNT